MNTPPIHPPLATLLRRLRPLGAHLTAGLRRPPQPPARWFDALECEANAMGPVVQVVQVVPVAPVAQVAPAVPAAPLQGAANARSRLPVLWRISAS